MGAYSLAGRLGEGGQGIVYLATDPGGAEVALKLLRADLAGDAEASERFVREVAMARRVAPFCTAQVVETGLFGGRPYIVSEYIDGPTLTDVVREQGPRSGSALHRLAIGTVTALVAIHQAGIVHRDFKPSNVLLASDGPRVIDFGIAKALDLTSTLTGAVIGTPAYMAPEQLTESGPGPKSDLFAWACTLLFAASGQAPFGQDSVPAVVNRILHHEPDTACVTDPALRALVTDCLAKDPARRPTSSEALMRLLGHHSAAPSHSHGPHSHGPHSHGPHSHGPHSHAPPHVRTPPAPGLLQRGTAAAAPGSTAGGSRGPLTRPAGRGRTGWVVAGGAAGALLLAAGGTFAAVRLSGIPERTTSPAPTSAAITTSAPQGTTAPAARSLTLPGTSVRLDERDGDPIRLASYTVDGGERLYVRKHATGRFAPDLRYFEYALDPATNLALGTDVDYSTDLYATVSIVDHVSDRSRVVELSRKPIFPTTPRWSPDGRYGLVTLYKGAEGDAEEHGYGIIDVAAGTGRAFEVDDAGAGEWRFFWDAGGRAVGTWTDGRMRFYDLNGKAVRTLSGVGTPVWVEGDDISPSGSRFLAHCTSAGTALCARPTSGGDAEPIRVPFASNRLIGWWDDEHLAVWRAKGGGYEAVVIDLTGKVGRVLATAGKKSEFDRMGFRFSRVSP
ncbi:protein kinase domain-containing protein [Nonomuraea gerenzanensis]|uniref:Putative serine/threonine protein kinase n=1 Tax=Nonomuraea gerenzanensis TaxID=93944 RepID=A0A1M4E6M9_9ACTN|nr:protein kinase [Nonomuraea gerenzanensis]UBU16744.1 protein kinase [Nonomuraea gerenzanensis]SBO94450.1 putative serine/threonine protein kinase [Nonomuraea gerenzanensis]